MFLFCFSFWARASEDMDAMVFLDQENGTLAAPSIKARQRLQSAPGELEQFHTNLTLMEYAFGQGWFIIQWSA